MRTGMRSAVFVAGACGGSLERERETAGLRGVKLRSVIGRIRSNFGLSPSRCFASPALSPSGGAARGDGRRAELSERAGQKTVGDSQGGGSPLGCDLCLLSVASQKVGASAARAGERKEIDSPREGRVCESKPVVVQPVNCGPLGRARLRHPGRGDATRRCSLRSPLAATRFFSAVRPGWRAERHPSSWRQRNCAHRAFCWPFGRESRSPSSAGIATPRRNRRRPAGPAAALKADTARHVKAGVGTAKPVGGGLCSPGYKPCPRQSAQPQFLS